MDYHKHMYIIRRMEITCDTEYKVRAVGLVVEWFVGLLVVVGFCAVFSGAS